MGNGYRGAGVYLFRTRRPGLAGQLPGYVAPTAAAVSTTILLTAGWWWPAGLLPLLLFSRHTAYIGESTAVRLRRDAHLHGSTRWKTAAKPWADLDPTWYFLPLPRAKWVLRSVETLGIVLFWPVYNHQKNRWNPRRIPLSSAKRQREQRDRLGWSFNLRPIHLLLIAVITTSLILKGWN